MLNFLLLQLIISKKARDEVPLGCEASIKNDDIYISYLENNISYGVISTSWNKVSVKGYREGTDEFVEEKEICAWAFGKKKLKIYHHYKFWRLEYSSLLEAVLKCRLGFNFFKWQASANNDKKLYSYYHRFELLQLLLNHREHNSTINFFKIKVLLYGNETEKRTDYTHNTDLCWKLKALKDSGDITFTDKVLYLEDIKILPQSLNTLSEYQKNEQENKKSKRVANAQLILSIILAISTSLQAYFAFIASST